MLVEVNKLIMQSMKAGDTVATDAYRAIKNEYLKFQTAKNAGILDDSQEISILRKMVNSRKENANFFSSNGRQDLADKELNELVVIEKLLPPSASEDDIRFFIIESYPSGIEQKQMGSIIKETKMKFPTADGKIISDIVKNYIK